MAMTKAEANEVKAKIDNARINLNNALGEINSIISKSVADTEQTKIIPTEQTGTEPSQ